MVPPLPERSTGLLFLFSPFIYIPAAQSQLHNHHTRYTQICEELKLLTMSIICSTSLMSELCVYNQCECCKYGKHRKCQIGSNGFRSIWQMRSDVRESNRIRSDQIMELRSDLIMNIWVLVRMGGQKMKRVQSRSVPPIRKTNPSPMSS